MYKVKQIADMLDVETVLIHELLIRYRDELSPSVVKKNSITYIDYDGYQLLKDLVQKSRENNLNNSSQIETQKIEKVSQNETEYFITNLPVNYKKFTDDINEVKSKISKLKQEISRIDILTNREEEALNYYRNIISKLL